MNWHPNNPKWLTSTTTPIHLTNPNLFENIDAIYQNTFKSQIKWWKAKSNVLYFFDIWKSNKSSMWKSCMHQSIFHEFYLCSQTFKILTHLDCVRSMCEYEWRQEKSFQVYTLAYWHQSLLLLTTLIWILFGVVVGEACWIFQWETHHATTAISFFISLFRAHQPISHVKVKRTYLS